MAGRWHVLIRSAGSADRLHVKVNLDQFELV